jgi:Arc/MetJ-type ribon-helix-helix transcriptional regulator
MTKKIGISLRDDLYDWAARQVEEGRAESVSALVADGLGALRGYAELEDLIHDLAADASQIDDETAARVEAAEQAAAAAYRARLTGKATGGQAA